MKKWSILSGVVLSAVVVTGCSSAYRSSAGYGAMIFMSRTTELKSPDVNSRRPRLAKPKRRPDVPKWEARIAEAQAQAAAAENAYDATASSNAYSYSGVLADSYESAYARRLRGFESLSYRMPSSYYDFRYGNAFTYVSAYDPAFYNIVVSGDQVWVEPKYISSMFGTWGATVYTGGWYGGWHAGWGFGRFVVGVILRSVGIGVSPIIRGRPVVSSRMAWRMGPRMARSLGLSASAQLPARQLFASESQRLASGGKCRRQSERWIRTRLQQWTSRKL